MDEPSPTPTPTPQPDRRSPLVVRGAAVAGALILVILVSALVRNAGGGDGAASESMRKGCRAAVEATSDYFADGAADLVSEARGYFAEAAAADDQWVDAQESFNTLVSLWYLASPGDPRFETKQAAIDRVEAACDRAEAS